MTTDQRFGILTSLISVLAAGILGMLFTMVRDHFTLVELVKNVRTLVDEKDEDHRGINERLTWLERRELKQYRSQQR